jgi:hypothetical protein
MDRCMEGFGSEADILPLHFAGGGSEAGIWTGREGEISDIHADAGEFHGVPGDRVLLHVQTKYCVPTVVNLNFSA